MVPTAESLACGSLRYAVRYHAWQHPIRLSTHATKRQILRGSMETVRNEFSFADCGRAGCFGGGDDYGNRNPPSGGFGVGGGFGGITSAATLALHPNSIPIQEDSRSGEMTAAPAGKIFLFRLLKTVHGKGLISTRA